ncbi:LANO_0G09142g1_1 [Lachancea nothofagi CBS 11611]|uniref:LANO_0G09142g1_1 n=1 Tax=Lachancea nothofagi CBS 11611 TaxID=1266666 RepID=A0A1G4KID1_9SACH|nr:LANO_0G09142g1_1 [Lachancea nothofagi CBS 11611]
MALFSELSIPQLNITYKQPLGLYINNEYVASSDQAQIETVNPANGKSITSFYAASAADVDKAVAAAREAYESVWSKTSAEERGVLLSRLGKLIAENKELLAAIETLDSGKPYFTNALADIDQICQLTTYYAGGADKYSKGQMIPINHDKYAYTVKAPYGVVAQVIPWNYPLAMASWKMQGALAAGNTIVIKPAENTSLSLLYFAQLFDQAGFPPGVVNVVPGYGSVTGHSLSSHKDVDKIAFTGSTAVGQQVMALAATSNLKAVTLECGGKSPAVVFEDANLDEAVKWTAAGIFYNSGQNCTANSRLLVQESVYDEFLAKFVKQAQEQWSFGKNGCDPFDESCTVGPVISKTQFDRIQGYINHGKVQEKLSLKQLEAPDATDGYFIAPTIFTEVPQDSKLTQEEIFGPVAVLLKFKDYDEALALANGTNYGLASAVFTEDIRKANHFARDIKAGTVWINSSNDEEVAVPFGGYKMSGLGRELGESGMDAYSQTKSVHVNISKL